MRTHKPVKKRSFLRRLLTGALAVCMMAGMAVTASAAKPPWNETVEEAGQRAAYVKIYLMDAGGSMIKEVTPGSGEKIYTNDWLSYKIYRSSNDLLLKSYSVPLSYIYIKENGSWKTAKDNLNNVGSQDLNVFVEEGSRSRMYYLKPGHYKSTHHGYVDYAYGCEIEYDVLPGPRPADPTGISIDPQTATIPLGQTVRFSATVTPENAEQKVTWEIRPVSGSVHGTLSHSGANTSSAGTYTGKSVGTDRVTVTASNGLAASATVTVQDCTSLTVTPGTVELRPGESTTVTPTASPAIFQPLITVSSGDPNVTASYNKNTGKITITAKDNSAAQAGLTTTVTAKAGTKSAPVTVKVLPAVSDLIVTPDSMELEIGETDRITVKRVPENAVESITFTSEDPAVAAVDENGKVTAAGEGKTNIAVSCGGVTKKVPVTVASKTPESPDLKNLAFDKGALEMEIGDIEDAPAHKIPADAPGDITYTTGDPGVATVDENGKVTAVGEGKTTITASCGDAEAKIPVTVTDPNKGGNDKEEDSELVIEYVFEDGSQAADTYKQDGAAGSSYSVESPSIGRRFVPSREVVEGEYTKAPTSVTITYKRIAALVETSASDGGSITGTDDFIPLGENKTVEYAPDESFRVSSVKVDGKAVPVEEHPTSYTFEDIQTDHTIDVAFEKDANAENPGDGDNSKPLTGIDFGRDKLTMEVGDAKTVPAVKVPADADGKITYTTSDPSVATVDKNGKITAVGEGVAIITASCGGKKDKIVVVVSDPGKDNNNGGNNGNTGDGISKRTGSIDIYNTGVDVAPSKAFIYKVIFPDNPNGEYEMSGDVRGKLKSGGTLVLYANESVTISGLPDGASCIVAQIGPSSRYVTRVSVNDGSYARKMTTGKFEVEAGETVSVEFINSRVSFGSSGSDRDDSLDRDHGNDRDRSDDDSGSGSSSQRPNENPGDKKPASDAETGRVPPKGNPHTGR